MFPFTDIELLNPVLNSISKVRPILLQDGGDIEVIKIENACVFVRFHGACSGCESRYLTLQNAITNTLQMDIHPDIKVVEVR